MLTLDLATFELLLLVRSSGHAELTFPIFGAAQMDF